MHVAPQRRLSLGRWVATVAPAEAVGFAFPVLALALTSRAAPLLAWPVIAVAGGCEGALLGLAQWARWRDVLPHLPARRYVGATAAAAVLAWAIGMAPSSLMDLGAEPDWSRPTVWLAVAAAGVCLLLSIPVAQAWALRGHLDRPRAWIGWTLLAWVLALPWSFAASPFVDESTPAWGLALGFGVGGVLMALTMALVTGAGARRLAH